MQNYSTDRTTYMNELIYQGQSLGIVCELFSFINMKRLQHTGILYLFTDVFSCSLGSTNNLFAALFVFFIYRARWTLRLTVRVLPIVDRLFQVKDKNVLNAVIELVQVLIRRYGKDIMKNKNPSKC